MTDHLKDWLDSWENNETPWQLVDVHPTFPRHYDRLIGATPKRVFVPLCGKSLDLKWLADRGNTVIGAEASEISVKGFFQDHNIPYSVKDMASASGGKTYISDDKKYTIYCCDMFALDPKQEPEFGIVDVVWDRGSLVALDVELRPKYMKVMNIVISPQISYLLEIPNREPLDGPPFYMSKDDIQSTFDNITCVEEIERIESKDLPLGRQPPKAIKGFIVYFLKFQ